MSISSGFVVLVPEFDLTVFAEASVIPGTVFDLGLWIYV